MPEKNDNPMPTVKNPKARAILAWVSWALLLSGPSLTALVLMLPQGTVHDVAVIVMGGMLSVAAAIKGGLSNPLGKSGAAVAGLLALVLLAGAAGCRNNEGGWRTVAAVQMAGNVTDRALDVALKRAEAHCVGKHGRASAEFGPCIRNTDAYKAVKHWHKIVVPAIDSVQLAAVGALQIADKSKAKAGWMAMLKPAVCALARVARQWGHLLGAAKTTILVAVSAAEGVTCD